MSKIGNDLKQLGKDFGNEIKNQTDIMIKSPEIKDIDVCRVEKAKRAVGIRIFYVLKFILRIIILVLSLAIFTLSFFHFADWCTGTFRDISLWCEEQFDVLDGYNMFKKFSVFDILFVLWAIDMLCQIIPLGKRISLGSKKVFRKYYKGEEHKIPKMYLKAYMRKQNKGAIVIFALWVIFLIFVAFLKFNPWFFTDYTATHIIDKSCFMISVAFYVCDLICVLIWCPFKLFFMKNRCCTTCRIFNWDHFMMLSPIMFIWGFFPLFLASGAFLTFFIWEFNILVNPEKFWEGTNKALRCENCTDLLCGKARKKNKSFEKLHTFLYSELLKLRKKFSKDDFEAKKELERKAEMAAKKEEASNVTSETVAEVAPTVENKEAVEENNTTAEVETNN